MRRRLRTGSAGSPRSARSDLLPPRAGARARRATRRERIPGDSQPSVWSSRTPLERPHEVIGMVPLTIERLGDAGFRDATAVFSQPRALPLAADAAQC